MPRVFVVVGPSGAGKGTLVQRVLAANPNLRLSRSYTTRDMREGEVDGVDYDFTTREIFMRMVEEDRFLEWAEVFGNLYGTPKPDPASEDQRDVLLEIDCQGAMQVRGKDPFAVIIFIYVPLEELEGRIRKRGKDSEGVIKKRLAAAPLELLQMEKCDYWIPNFDIDEAAITLLLLIDMLQQGLKPSRSLFRSKEICGISKPLAERLRLIEPQF